MAKFKGFPEPNSSGFMLPDNWTDITHDMTLAELKVVEYVIRHTWGKTAAGQNLRPVQITIDEFVHGRKAKDGKRIDRGTGLSAGAASTGVKLAVKHGYLRMIEDRTDGGRIKRYFVPMVLKDNEKSHFSDSDSLTSDCGEIEK